MNLEEFYQGVGGDYSEMLARFQDDQRILKFLRMFLSDDSMQSLSVAVAEGNAETAFRAVHTLKGIALNLGFEELATKCSRMTEALRGKSEMCDPALYKEVLAAYNAVRQALDALD